MEDADGSKYRLGSCKQFTQALHCVQVMLLPVSNINVNFCGGVPKATSTRNCHLHQTAYYWGYDLSNSLERIG